MGTASATARVRARSYPAWVPSPSSRWQDLHRPEARHLLGHANIETRVLGLPSRTRPSRPHRADGHPGHDDALAAEAISPSRTSSGRRTAEELRLTLSAPARNSSVIPSTVLMLPPTVKGIVIDSAVRRTMSIKVPRPSWLAAMSRNTSSSALHGVTAGQLDRIAGIAQANEIDHHPSTGDIEAGNQTQSNHRFGAKRLLGLRHSPSLAGHVPGRRHLDRFRFVRPVCAIAFPRRWWTFSRRQRYVKHGTVDGKNGVVVELSDGSTSWFFEDELPPPEDWPASDARQLPALRSPAPSISGSCGCS